MRGRRAGIGMALGAAAAIFAAAAPAAAQESGDGAALRAPRWDWTADRRRFVEGDIITVLVDEYTLASANKNSLAQRNRSRDLDLDGGFDTRSTTASGLDANAGVRSRVGGESRQRGQTTRQDRLTSEITVRVTGIEPSGALRIEGRKRMVIDEHEQEILLSGLLRPEDVPANNVVDSWRVADASIAYESNGKLDNPKGSVLGRILGWFWP